MPWKCLLVFVAIFLILPDLPLFAQIIIPFSEEKLQTPQNHFTEKDFYRTSPEDSLACPITIDVWLWHDSNNLHLYWESEKGENFTEGIFTREDKWIEADFVRLQLITDINNYYAYLFYAFPLGNKYDGIRNSSLGIDTSWDSGYKYTTSVENSIWKCHMVIPFKDIRFHGKSPYNWKIILTRRTKEPDEYYSAPYVSLKDGKDYFRKAIDIIIEDQIHGSKNYRIRPYLAMHYDIKGDDFSFNIENTGLDFSYNPGFASRVKVSINPDYSDVPMDSETDIYNLRHPPHFSENRYFFVEDLDVFGISSGSDIFNLFYSRHIMQPRIALKVTADTPEYSYGILSAWDKEVKVDTTVTNPDDLYNMLAYKRKFTNLSLQFTLLNRMNKDYHNEVLHILVPSWEVAKNHSLFGMLDLSLQEKNDESQSGYLGGVGYNGRYKDLEWHVDIFQISENFSPDMGWIDVTDVFGGDINTSIGREPNRKVIKEYGGFIGYHILKYNKSNDLFLENLSLNIWMNTQNKINPWINYNIGKEGYKDNIYDYDNLWVGISWDMRDWLKWSIQTGFVNQLVYDLEDVYKFRCYVFSLSGTLSRYLRYYLWATRNIYYDFPPDAVSRGLDDDYWIGNADLTLSLSNQIGITSGLRFNNYETGEQSTYLGMFVNFSWEFMPDCNLYLGYKNASEEIDQKFESSLNQTYMKISYTF